MLTPEHLLVWLFVAATVVVVAKFKWSKWIAPDWRHELTNTVIGWVVLGLLGLIVAGLYGWASFTKSADDVSSNIYDAEIRVVFASDNCEIPLRWLAVGNFSAGEVMLPVNYSLYASLTNVTSEARRIVGLAVDIRDSSGQ